MDFARAPNGLQSLGWELEDGVTALCESGSNAHTPGLMGLSDVQRGEGRFCAQ